MPLLHRPSTAAPRPKAAALGNGLQTAPPLAQTETEAELSAAVSPAEKASHLRERFRLSSAGVAPALKVGAFWFVSSLIFTALQAKSRAAHNKPVTPFYLFGELLSHCLFFLAWVHIANFKGESPRAWAGTWLFRFVVIFISSCASGVARHGAGYHNWIGDGHWVAAFIIATLSSLWQWDKQKQAEKKRAAELSNQSKVR